MPDPTPTLRRGPIRVLVVDDSPVVRQLLSRDLSAVPGIEVVGDASDPQRARDLVLELQPDVLTLDVELPRSDGVTFLSRLMEARATPTIAVSSLTPRGSRTAIAALEAGAVDIACKPNGSFSAADLSQQLVEKIRVAATARLRLPAPISFAAPIVMMAGGSDKLIAIGAGTGGVQALAEVLPRLPADAPGVVLVQHLPPGFTGSFARRMNELCSVRVAEACGGESVLPGHVLIAPGGRHLRLNRSGSCLFVELADGPPVHHQKPAVDVLFESVARHAGANAVGAVLTGTGADGATGLLAMRNVGARTVAQDEATCVVCGMPAEAARMGAAEEIRPLDDLTTTLCRLATTRRAA